MTRVAHLSDLHLLEEACDRRRGLARYRLAYLSAGVPYDPIGRRTRAARALARARRAGAEHVLLTGDLTEDGTPAQFDLLRQLLDDSGFVPEQVTLVPGNHDVYADPRGWTRAVAGPLRAYCPGGGRAVAVLDELVIKPVATMIESQSFAVSVGHIRKADVEHAAGLARDSVCRGRAFLLAMHHPPLGLGNPLVNAVDGVRDPKPMRALLRERPEVRVVHGHIHRTVQRRLGGRGHAQVFATPAVRDDDDPVRLYRAEAGGFSPLADGPSPARAGADGPGGAPRPEPAASL